MAAPMPEFSRLTSPDHRMDKALPSHGNAIQKNKVRISQNHVNITIPPTSSPQHGISRQIIQNLKIARYIIYIKRQRHCEDVCLFNRQGKFLVSSRDLRKQCKEEKEDLCRWGSEIFSHNVQSSRKIDDRVTNLEQCDTQGCFKDHEKTSLQVNTAYHLTQNPRLAAAVVTSCKTSPVFLEGFHRFAYHHFLKYHVDTWPPHGEETVSYPVCIVVHIQRVICDQIDHAWDERIHHLVGKRGVLDDAMSWLNTLGGGYSALGDYFKHHAKQAGAISLRQLRVAVDMGDPPTVIRCHLYFGLSLMQCGHLQRSKKIIRRQFHLAKKVAIGDTRLVASCHGLWSRLQYLYRLQRQRRQHPSG